MSVGGRRRTWLLLAVTITLQILIFRSTKALKSDGASITTGQRFVKRAEAPSQTPLFAVASQTWFTETPAHLKPLVALGYMFILIFLFSFIGISASDFFCPNLSSIAAYLGLTESTAGVTFLAFGNGSPDVFSTFSALKGGTFGLAIGELIGAASFIVSIVVGTIALIRPFHVPRHAFIRDITFFTSAVVVLIAVLHDGHLTVAESAGMVALYIAYVANVVAGNWWSRRQRDKETSRALKWERDHPPSFPALIVPEPTVESPASTDLPPHPALLPTASPRLGLSRSRSNTTSSRYSPRMAAAPPYLDTPRANFSLLGAIEFRDVVNSLRKESESQSRSSTPRTQRSPSPERTDYFGRVPLGHRRAVSHQGIDILRGDSHRGRRSITHSPLLRGDAGPSGARNYLNLLTTATASTSTPATQPPPQLDPWRDQAGRPDRPRVLIPGEAQTGSSIPSISITDPAGLAGNPVTASPPRLPQIPIPNPNGSRLQLRRRTRMALRILFPSLQSFRHKSYLGMVLAVMSVPAILALTVSLPVVDDGQTEGAVALPIAEHEALDEGADLPADGVPEADENRLVNTDVGEELHHLVESGFSPLHSPRRISHSALRRLSVDGLDQGRMNKELLEEIREEEELEFHKSLTAVQCILGPMFCVFIMFSETTIFPWILLAAGLAGTAAAIAVMYIATDGTSQTWKIVRCFAGFVCSMVWIAAIADEAVSVLQAVGLILGLSDAIIGLTTDLVADVTVAQFAPAMAYAACFGGPMLNLLLGVGGSGTYHMLLVTHDPVTINFSPTLWVSASGLVVILVATAIFVPLNGYLIDRRWAGCLIVAYVVLMVVNVMVEVKTGRG